MSSIGAKTNALTDWILIGEFTFGEGFADQNHPGRVCAVAFVEQAATPQGNAPWFRSSPGSRNSAGHLRSGGVRLELHAVDVEIAA